jgi:hypothetical protein
MGWLQAARGGIVEHKRIKVNRSRVKERHGHPGKAGKGN